MHCAHCVEISHFVNVAKHTRDHCSVLNNFALTTYKLLLELHAHTQAACSYACTVRKWEMVWLYRLNDGFYRLNNSLLQKSFNRLHWQFILREDRHSRIGWCCHTSTGFWWYRAKILRRKISERVEKEGKKEKERWWKIKWDILFT